MKCTTHFLTSYSIIIRLHAFHQWVRVAALCVYVDVKKVALSVMQLPFFFLLLFSPLSHPIQFKIPNTCLTMKSIQCFSPFFLCFFVFISRRLLHKTLNVSPIHCFNVTSKIFPQTRIVEWIAAQRKKKWRKNVANHDGEQASESNGAMWDTHSKTI